MIKGPYATNTKGMEDFEADLQEIQEMPGIINCANGEYFYQYWIGKEKPEENKLGFLKKVFGK